VTIGVIRELRRLAELIAKRHWCYIVVPVIKKADAKVVVTRQIAAAAPESATEFGSTRANGSSASWATVVMSAPLS